MDELMQTKLSLSTLSDLPETVARPTYDRRDLSPGIVHIGVGNFHRAHQAWYLHRLFEMGLNHDWAIIGAGVRSFDAAQREKLLSQDCLTTLIELDPSKKSAEVVGAMIDYVLIEEGNGPLIMQLADPAIRIVSLTVTEGGYYIDPVTKDFDVGHPDIQYDAANPETPRTAFGAIVAALKQRRDKGVGPFTGLSCDNILSNGDILRQTVVSLARMTNPDLSEWIDANCSFPNSMVDCIVPATGHMELALAAEFGISDQAPVTHENFRQWVLEDNFCAGRPNWEEVGVTFSDNLHGYEVQKICILNAGHQIIANVGEVLHLETIAEAMAHPRILALFRKIQTTEIAPHIKPVPGMTPLQYIHLTERRFSNSEIVDSVRRVAFDGSSRHPGFVLPTVRDGLATGTSVQGLALAEAIWARMCEGTREDGTIIKPNDPFWVDLTAAAKAAKETPGAWLEQRQVYGDLADQTCFAQAFSKWMSLIWDQGVETAIEEYCRSTDAL